MSKVVVVALVAAALVASVLLLLGSPYGHGPAASRALAANSVEVVQGECPTAGKTASLFTTEKDRAGIELGKWSVGPGRSEESSPPPAELGGWVFWEVIPGIFEVGQDHFRNLFDALPQFATFAQNGDRRLYSLSTILSQTYNITHQDGGIKHSGWFGTPKNPGPMDCSQPPVGHTRPCWSPFSAARFLQGTSTRANAPAANPPTAMVSPNVHIMRIRGHTIGMGGATGWTEVTRDASGRVSTVGDVEFDDDLEKTLIGQCNTSPHTIYDTDLEQHVGASLCVGLIPHTPLTHKIKIWTMDEYTPSTGRVPGAPLTRQLLAEIGTDRLFDLHSFGLSERYVTIFESSPTFESLNLIGHKLFDNLQMLDTMCDWQDKDANPSSTLVRVDRSTGKWMRFKIDGPVGKVEHTGGSYDLPDGSTIVDFMSETPGNGPAFVLSSEFARLLYHTAESDALLDQHLIRCVIPPAQEGEGQTVKCHEQVPGHRFGPFIVTNPASYRRPYKFTYHTYPNSSALLGISDGLVKVDVAAGRIVASSYSSLPAGRFIVNEPRFVPRHPAVGGEAKSALAEDDGLMVATMYDTAEDRSFQAVFDAADLSLIGSFDFGRPDEPAGAGRMRVAFHGMHCPADSDGPCLRL